MPRFDSKILLGSALIAAVITFFLIAYAAGRVILANQKHAIESSLSQSFGQPVRIREIVYVPPLFVVLRDVLVENSSPGAGPLLRVERVNLGLSPLALFNEQRFALRHIHLVHPLIDLSADPQFLSEHLRGSIAAIAGAAHGPTLAVSVEEARFEVRRTDAGIGAVVASLRVDFEARQRVVSSGSIRFDELAGAMPLGEKLRGRSRAALSYRFSGSVVPEGVTINELTIRQGDIRLSCDGSVQQDTLILGGSGRVDNYYYDKRLLVPGQEKLTLKGLVDMIAGRSAREPGLADLPLTGLSVRLKLLPRAVMMEEAAITVGEIPVRVRGDIAAGESIRLRLQAGIFPDAAENTPEFLRRIDAGVDGAWQAGCFSGEAWLSRVNKDAPRSPMHLVRTTVQEATVSMAKDRRLSVTAPNADITVKIGREHQALFLTDVDVGLGLADMLALEATLTARLFDGEVKGRAYLDRHRHPAGAGVDLTVRGVSANQLDELLLSLFGPYRRLSVRLPAERITGTFDGDIHYTNLPRPELRGDMTIANGTLKSVRFGVWLADFFGLAALRNLEFSRLGGVFRMSEDAVDLQEITLDSAPAKISGSVRLEKSEWLSGKLTLIVPVKVLAESRKFQKLISLLRGELDQLEFSFQLSGLYKTPNFKWQQSVFKQKLQERLPGFVARGIERKVEQAMQGIAGE